jgi:hypothetical protein
LEALIERHASGILSRPVLDGAYPKSIARTKRQEKIMAQPPLIDQPDNMPTNKVLAAGIAGAIVTVAIFVAQQFQPGFTMPAEVVAASTTIVSFACAYLVRNRAIEPAATGAVLPAE